MTTIVVPNISDPKDYIPFMHTAASAGLVLSLLSKYSYPISICNPALSILFISERLPNEVKDGASSPPPRALLSPPPASRRRSICLVCRASRSALAYLSSINMQTEWHADAADGEPDSSFSPFSLGPAGGENEEVLRGERGLRKTAGDVWH